MKCPNVAAVTALAVMLVASVARASVCDLTHSVFPKCGIMLPGLGDTHEPVLGDAVTAFTVVVLCNGSPVPGIYVYLDASAAPDIRFADVQEAETFVDCQYQRIFRAVDARGSVTFHIRGAGRNSLPRGGIGPGGMSQVTLRGGSLFSLQFIGQVTLATPDQNGAGVGGTVTNGIDAGDGSFIRYDILNYNLPGQAGRSDLNCNGVVDATDGAIEREFILMDLVSAAPQTTTYCP